MGLGEPEPAAERRNRLDLNPGVSWSANAGELALGRAFSQVTRWQTLHVCPDATLDRGSGVSNP